MQSEQSPGVSQLWCVESNIFLYPSTSACGRVRVWRALRVRVPVACNSAAQMIEREMNDQVTRLEPEGDSASSREPNGAERGHGVPVPRSGLRRNEGPYRSK